MNKEIEELLHWFDNTLKSYELDKKTGQLTTDSIYPLFPSQQEIIISTIKDLQQRIDKAIEYISKNRAGFIQPIKYIELLSILKGEDKEC